MNLLFRPKAWEQFQFWQETDKANVKKINTLIKECLRHPDAGTGKPEPLKGDLAGYWSRRIDREHRLLYSVTPSGLELRSCRSHSG